MRAEAERLRAEGRSYRQIAEALGVTTTTAWRWLNPDAQRELNLRQRETKRKWDRNNYWRKFEQCRCGGWKLKGSRTCRACLSRPRPANGNGRVMD